MLSSRREDEKKRGFRNSTLRRHWDKEESAKDTWEGAIANGGREELRSCVLLGKWLNFKSFWKSSKIKTKLTLEIDQMELLRDLGRKNFNGVLSIEYKLGWVLSGKLGKGKHTEELKRFFFYHLLWPKGFFVSGYLRSWGYIDRGIYIFIRYFNTTLAYLKFVCSNSSVVNLIRKIVMTSSLLLIDSHFLNI